MPRLRHVPESLDNARNREDAMRQRAECSVGDMLRQFAEQAFDERGFFCEKSAQIYSTEGYVLPEPPQSQFTVLVNVTLAKFQEAPIRGQTHNALLYSLAG
jgi:hypothetical protein